MQRRLPLLVVFTLVVYIGTTLAKQKVRIEALRTCTRNGVYIGQVIYENITVIKNKNQAVMSADVRIMKTLPPRMPGEVIISKCRSSAANDCNKILNLKNDDFCVMIRIKNPLYDNFMESLKPKPNCPMKEGFYKLRNATFDEGKLSAYFNIVPMDPNSRVAYYALRVAIGAKNNEDPFLCIDMVFRQIRI